jgi:hypothetical protein
MTIKTTTTRFLLHVEPVVQQLQPNIEQYWHARSDPSQPGVPCNEKPNEADILEVKSGQQHGFAGDLSCEGLLLNSNRTRLDTN